VVSGTKTHCQEVTITMGPIEARGVARPDTKHSPDAGGKTARPDTKNSLEKREKTTWPVAKHSRAARRNTARPDAKHSRATKGKTARPDARRARQQRGKMGTRPTEGTSRASANRRGYKCGSRRASTHAVGAASIEKIAIFDPHLELPTLSIVWRSGPVLTTGSHENAALSFVDTRACTLQRARTRINQ